MKLFLPFLIVFSNLLFVIHGEANNLTEFHGPTIVIEVSSNVNKGLNPNVISDFQFKPLASTLLKKETRYWLRITVDNNALTEKKNYIYFNNVFAELALWQKGENGMWISKSVGGYNIPYREREGGCIIGDKLLFHTSAGKETKLLISVYQPYRDVTLNNQCLLISQKKYETINKHTEDVQFMFAGIIFILCLFSFILFVFTREVVYLMYFLYALCTELYFLSFFNIIVISFFTNYPGINRYFFF